MVRRLNNQRRNNYQGSESQTGNPQQNFGQESVQAESRGRIQGAQGSGSGGARFGGLGNNHQAGRIGGHERSHLQRNRLSQESGIRKEAGQSREKAYSRTSNRDSTGRPGGYSSQSGISKINEKSKVEETVEDIKADILRLEKEIKLEIEEIRSLKLGL